METQHECSNTHHIIHVRERNEPNCSQMMDEHDQEVLETEKWIKTLWLSNKYIMPGAEPQNWPTEVTRGLQFRLRLHTKHSSSHISHHHCRLQKGLSQHVCFYEVVTACTGTAQSLWHKRSRQKQVWLQNPLKGLTGQHTALIFGSLWLYSHTAGLFSTWHKL